MERLKFRSCGARVALVLGVFLGGCQVTLPPDLVIQCSDPGRACPPGYECSDDDVCVRDGVPDGGGSDASPDATFDGDSRDSGPGDARPVDGEGGEPDATGDAGPPDPDAGPPPPPPLVAEISADGRQTVDGIAVGEGMDTNSIYVVGTHFGGHMCFTPSMCSAGPHGVYVATFRVIPGTLDFVGATFFEGGERGGDVDIKPAGIGVLEGGQLVIGGTYTGAISNTSPEITNRGGEVGAFVLKLAAPESGGATRPARAVNWPLGSEGSMSEIDAHRDTWCAVGFDGTNPAEPGFLVCEEAGEELMEHGLGGGAANDLDMSREPWQMAWSVVGLSRATAASFDAASGVMNARYRSDRGPSSTGELVAANGSDVVLVARESANSLQVLGGILVDDMPGMPSMESPAWTASLGATDGVFARDMLVANSHLEVHVVGQVAGAPRGILAGQGGNDGDRGYYAVISDSDEARVHFANELGTSDFRAIAAMDDGSIVIGGQGTGPLTFPEVMLGDILDGFIMVIPPTP